jgi:hypothetical protein
MKMKRERLETLINIQTALALFLSHVLILNENEA